MPLLTMTQSSSKILRQNQTSFDQSIHSNHLEIKFKSQESREIVMSKEVVCSQLESTHFQHQGTSAACVWRKNLKLKDPKFVPDLGKVPPLLYIKRGITKLTIL